MKNVFLIVIIFLFSVSQNNIHVLAPWHSSETMRSLTKPSTDENPPLSDNDTKTATETDPMSQEDLDNTPNIDTPVVATEIFDSTPKE